MVSQIRCIPLERKVRFQHVFEDKSRAHHLVPRRWKARAFGGRDNNGGLRGTMAAHEDNLLFNANTNHQSGMEQLHDPKSKHGSGLSSEESEIVFSWNVRRRRKSELAATLTSSEPSSHFRPIALHGAL